MIDKYSKAFQNISTATGETWEKKRHNKISENHLNQALIFGCLPSILRGVGFQAKYKISQTSKPPNKF